MRALSLLLLTTALALTAGTVETPVPHADLRGESRQPHAAQTGVASYYADEYHGRPTASGEIFDTYKLTAAHGTLPFGTVVRVTNPENQRSVTVRINDRGPFVPGRIIDLSRAAAKQLLLEKAGLATVRIEIIPATTDELSKP